MSSDPTKAGVDGTGAPSAPEADLPQAPPGAPEGHDAPPPGKEGAAGRPAEPAPTTEAPTPNGGADGSEPGEPLVTSLADADLETLTAKAQKADEYLALAQRAKADFENYRKRAVRDAAAAQERGALKLAQALLPAIDNLDRALAHSDALVAGEEEGAGGNGAASFVAGIKHVHADVIGALGNAGIERYSPEGEKFDPQYHEAVAQQPVEGTEPGVVVEVFQHGYRMGENVLRPARVVVAG